MKATPDEIKNPKMKTLIFSEIKEKRCSDEFFGFGKSAEVSIVLRELNTGEGFPHRVSDRRKKNYLNLKKSFQKGKEDLLLYYDEKQSGHIQIDSKRQIWAQYMI